MTDRREFLITSLKCAAVLGVAATAPRWLRRAFGEDFNLASIIAEPALAAEKLADLIARAPRARYWISTTSAGMNCRQCHTPDEVQQLKSHQHKTDYVKCQLCAQECVIKEGERGGCRARINVKGELRTLVYGRPISIHIDPIEKKPFYHFLPGSQAYSLATSGCPLHCKFCQNWEISQARPEDYSVDWTPPESIADNCQTRRVPVIAFTYNEPTTFTEYLTDIARAAQKRNIRSVLISCGFMQEAPLAEMCEVLSAIKIDLKGFSEDFYKNVCQARLAPVLRSIKQVARSKAHLEIVNLVVPTLNDSNKMMKDLVDWIFNELGPDIPVHFTRFHPDYQLLNLPPTPVAALEIARELALKKGLNYAFVGNVPGHPGNNTYCPKCGKAVIERSNFFVTRTRMKNGCCLDCGQAIAGIWL